MQLTTWRPFREIDDVFRRYASNLDVRLPSASSDASASSVWEPSADISETNEEYLVNAVLPGVEKEDIQVNLNENMLTISGNRKHQSENKEEKIHRIESFYGSFSRTFSLPADVDSEKLKAKYSNGVLSVHLPKLQTEKATSARKIPIK